MLNTAPRQRGAALVVGLILLMVLTVLGVSGMTTSTLELVMADNMQRGQYVFQAAESAVNAEMNVVAGAFSLTGTEARDDAVAPTAPYIFSDAAGVPVANVAVDTTFQSLTQFGEGVGRVHLESRAVATSPARGARSAQRQGFFVLAPPPAGR